MSVKDITGTMFAYSYLCPRKLWLFSHNISLETESEDVKIGKIIDEYTYKKEKKNINIDSVCIDFLADGIVYEVKKSLAEKDMAIKQIKYYLYILKNKGVENPLGVLKIPKIKYQEEIYLNDEDVKEIKNKLFEINKIITSAVMPKDNNLKACSKCAYYALCKI